MKLINKNQPVKLSDGRAARILGEISNGTALVLVVAFQKGDAVGTERVGLFDYDGASQWPLGQYEKLTLVNVPRRFSTGTRYAFVFEDMFFFTNEDKNFGGIKDNEARHGKLVARVPLILNVEEGEGL